MNKKELLQTSAQDQFAKWAKLRRSVDKGLTDLEKLSEYQSYLTRRRTCVQYTNLLFCFLYRRRALKHKIVILHEVQLSSVVLYRRPSIYRGLVVPQDCRVLSAAWMVRTVDMVALLPLCPRGLRELWGMADEL